MARSTSTAERLEKLERLMHNSGATAGEKAAAKAAWERIAGRTYSAGSTSSSPRNSSSTGTRSGYASAYRGYADASKTYRQHYQQAKQAAWDAARATREYESWSRSNTRADLIALGVAAGLYTGAVIYANRNNIKRAVKNRIDKIRTAFKGSRAASDASAA